MSNKVYVPHVSTAGIEVSKVCFSPWYLVMSTLFVLTYHPSIRSSLHINFTSLAIITHFKRELYKHHVRDLESTRLRKIGPSLVFYPQPIEEWFSLSDDEIGQSPPSFSSYLNKSVEYETWAEKSPELHI